MEIPTLVPPRPLITPTAQPFWSALTRHRVEIQHCDSCDGWVHYPRNRCPACGSARLHFEEVDPTGRIVTFTVTRQSVAPHFDALGPIVIAVVELGCGVRLTANIVDTAPDLVEVGQVVDPVYLDGQDGITVLAFAPRPG